MPMTESPIRLDVRLPVHRDHGFRPPGELVSASAVLDADLVARMGALRLSGTAAALSVAVFAVACRHGGLGRARLSVSDHEPASLSDDESWTRLVDTAAKALGSQGAGPDLDLELTSDADTVVAWRLRDRDGAVTLTVSCEKRWWSPATVAAMPAAVLRVLGVMMRFEESRAEPLNAAEVFSTEQYEQMLALCRGPRPVWDLERCLLSHITEQARLHPQRVAVRGEESELTYAELVAHAERTAAKLLEAGCQPGDIVTLLLPRGPLLIAAMLGAWRARTAFVALDPARDLATWERILRVSQPACVVADREHADRCRGAEVGADLTWIGFEEPAAAEAALPAACCMPDDRAYVMFTSGSTGEPKGAIVEQRGMLNHAMAKLSDLGVGDADVIAQTGPVGFDIVVWQCVAGLMRGARVEIVSDTWAKDARWLLGEIDRRDITVWQALPAVIRASLELSRQRRPALRALRWLVPTGDALPADLCRDWLDQYPHIPILNTYGSTECSDDQCHRRIDAVDVEDPAIMWIGTPIPGMRAYPLDARGRVVPVGVPGELHIGGLGVGPGYLGREDLTARQFINTPVVPGESRLYCSGDLVRQRSNGEFEFLTRKDDTVKVRGRRVEISITESALRQVEGVEDCVVLGLRSEGDVTDTRLHAYVVAADGDGSLIERVLTHAREVLDSEYVPALVHRIPALPLSVNGKVDRRALAALHTDPESAEAHPSEEPRDDLERKLAAIWAETLGVATVRRHDDFIKLGGHSLLAARMFRRIETDLGARLPLHTVFEAPTVAGLARAVARAEDSARPSNALRVPLADSGAFQLTDLQQAYWVGEGDFFSGGGLRAHLFAAFDSETLDPERARAALDAVIARHDALRLVVGEDGNPRILSEVPTFPLQYVDLLAEPEAARADYLDAAHASFRDEGPSTDAWPLFDVTVVRSTPTRLRVLLRISLIVVDAYSESLLLADFLAAYRGERLAERDPDSPRIDELAATAAGLAASATGTRAVEYWTERLARLPQAPQLPRRSGPAEPHPGPPRFHRRTLTLESGSWKAFKSSAAACGVTPSAALFALYAEVLAAWSKQPRFAVNTLSSLRVPLCGRGDAVAGNLSSTMPVAVDCTSQAPFAARARELQQQVLLDLEHAEASGISLSRAMAAEHGWAADLSLPVVFASALDVDNSWADDIPFDVRELAGGLQTPHVLLDHQVYEYGGSLVANFDSVDAVFPPGVVDAMWSAYQDTLETLAAHPWAWELPCSPLARIDRPALVPDARNPSAAPVLLHAGLIGTACARPYSPAVIDGDLVISYAGIVAAARQVAARLSDAGVGRGALVAQVLRRGWRQVAAMIGTHLVGGAYLPVDPALPDSRIRHLFDQATVRAVLTQPDLAQRVDSLGGDAVVIEDRETRKFDDHKREYGPSHPDDTAYVIFTSGSTGAPKGVAVTHRAAWNTVAAVNEMCRMDPRDRTLALSSTSFDLSVWDVFGTLASGGALVMLDPEQYRDPEHWLELMGRHRVTIWNSVPALLEMLVTHLETAAAPTAPAPRLAMLSGDWIPVALPARARRVFGELELYSLGGATEAAIWSIVHRIDRVDPGWTSIPYGRGLPGQDVHVLDHRLEPRPDHVVGELYISGAGLALGYWRQPELTAQRFVTHPRSGVRLYRTGDLGLRGADGEIEFLGREDGQVKIRGMRVELGEVEAHLAVHPGVQAAAAVVRDGRQGRSLFAFAVPRSDGITESELQEYLGQRVPGYMVPSRIGFVDRLPLSGNGKVDRSKLPGLDEPETASAVSRPAKDGLERSVVDAMARILGIRREIGATEDFFALGGNSFSAMRLTALLRELTGTRIRLSELFREPTGERLAALLRQDGGSGPALCSLLDLRAGAGGTPLYLIHPVGGSAFCYREIARSLSGRSAVLGIQRDTAGTMSLRGLASVYADLVDAHSPAGPIALGGWSMGGVLAFEAARDLRARGRSIALVAVIDSAPEERCAVPDGHTAVDGFLADLLLGREPLAEYREWFAAVLDPAAEDQAAKALSSLVDVGVLPDGVGVDLVRERFTIFETNSAALAEHRVESADLPVLAFAGGQSHLTPTATGPAWLGYSAGTVIESLAQDDHYSIVTASAAQRIARAIDTRLEDGEP